MSDKKQLTSEEYAKADGLKCPNCGSTDISADGRLEADAGIAWQPVSCAECNATWNDEYTLTGYGELEP